MSEKAIFIEKQLNLVILNMSLDFFQMCEGGL